MIKFLEVINYKELKINKYLYQNTSTIHHFTRQSSSNIYPLGQKGKQMKIHIKYKREQGGGKCHHAAQNSLNLKPGLWQFERKWPSQAHRKVALLEVWSHSQVWLCWWRYEVSEAHVSLQLPADWGFKCKTLSFLPNTMSECSHTPGAAVNGLNI